MVIPERKKKFLALAFNKLTLNQFSSEKVPHYRLVWTRFGQSIIIGKVANVSFVNKQNEIVNKNTKYKRTKNRTLGVPNLNTYQLAYPGLTFTLCFRFVK